MLAVARYCIVSLQTSQVLEDLGTDVAGGVGGVLVEDGEEFVTRFALLLGEIGFGEDVQYDLSGYCED